MTAEINTTRIKICGNTNVPDLALAARSGADFTGVIVDFPPSPRSVSLETARDLRDAARDHNCSFVQVTVNLNFDQLRRLQDELQPDVLQLHGDETPDLVAKLKQNGATIWAAVHDAARANDLINAGANAILVDARITIAGGTIYGGTGQLSDWNLARALKASGANVILAGGLTPENVGDAIRDVKPFAVDAVSGVETRKGVKDHTKVVSFIAAVRSTI